MLTEVRFTGRAMFAVLALITSAIVVLALMDVELSKVADSVAIVTAPLAVAGLFLAAWQLARTTRAAQAATAAAKSAAGDFVSHRLLSLIGDAHRIATALDAASDPANPDSHRMRESLLDWNRVGGELRGLLEGRDGAPQQLLDDMTETFALATSAKESLMMGVGEPTAVAQAVRTKLGDVTVALGILSGTLQTSIGKEGEG